MTVIGFIIILGVIFSYFTMMFVFHRFTYKTWIFDALIGVGMVMVITSWFQEGGNWLLWIAIAHGVIWFLVSRAELRIVGSNKLNLSVGDNLPAMTFFKTDGTAYTEQDLIANAPALLALYRGWWCPLSKLQLDEIIGNYDLLKQKGVSIYAE